MKRRTFIKTTALATVSTMMVPGLLKAAPLKKNIGLQLYTLRNPMQQDLPGTLRLIAKTGYSWLEAAGYSEGKFYGFSPRDFKNMVEELGMSMISSHAAFNPEDQQLAIDAHAELGVKYIVCPVMPFEERVTADDFSKAAARLNEIGEACGKSGLKFGYHNHNFEFVKINDSTGYDLLLTLTDPKWVCFESDFYWMVYAGIDPLDYFRKYPGRFELWHVKDMENNPDKDFAPVGTGIIDFEAIFSLKDVAGLAYFFVEQDDCKIDPFDSVKISYKNLLKTAY
jgi:sugar phosphate isomerase/epimerase